MGTSSITVDNLVALDDVKGIKLEWVVTDPWPKETHYSLDAVEVWASATNDRAAASKVGEGITDFSHAGLGRGDVRYYWIKARDKLGDYGAWHPSGATSGVVGTEVSGDILIDEDGYWKHPSGLIEQWGRKNLSGGGGTVTFPLEFPNSCFQVIAIPFIAADSTTLYSIKTNSFNTITAELQANKVTDAAGVTSATVAALWRALGH